MEQDNAAYSAPVKHPPGDDFEPQHCLSLPRVFDSPTKHAVRRRLEDDQPVWLLTEGGRAVFCAHLAARQPWTAYPQDFVEELSHYTKVSPPDGLGNWQFHMVNLLWRYQDFAFRRSDLEHFKNALYQAMQRHPHPEWFPQFSEDSDVIQSVNKTGQWGIKHQTESLETAAGHKTTHYMLRRPLEYDRKQREPGNGVRQPEVPHCDCAPDSPSDSKSDRDDAIDIQRARVIDYLYDTWIARPASEWTVEGHLDPHNKDSGIVAQPSEYNRHMRDKYKFDEYGMKECPSATHLSERLTDFFPDPQEQDVIYQRLRQLRESRGEPE